jgi:hypothetical protein
MERALVLASNLAFLSTTAVAIAHRRLLPVELVWTWIALALSVGYHWTADLDVASTLSTSTLARADIVWGYGLFPVLAAHVAPTARRAAFAVVAGGLCLLAAGLASSNEAEVAAAALVPAALALWTSCSCGREAPAAPGDLASVRASCELVPTTYARAPHRPRRVLAAAAGFALAFLCYGLSLWYAYAFWHSCWHVAVGVSFALFVSAWSPEGGADADSDGGADGGAGAGAGSASAAEMVGV